MQGVVLARSRMRPRRALVCLALVVALATLAGCDNSTASLPTSTPDCAMDAHCYLAAPPCGPMIASSQFTDGLWISDRAIPQNADGLLGFTPLLPTPSPQGTRWYRLALLAHETLPNGAALLHLGYGFFPPQPTGKGYVTDSIFTVDETQGPLDPMANLSYPGQNPQDGDGPLQVHDHIAAQVGAAPAVIYHLAGGDSFHHAIVAVEIIWKSGSTTLRVFTVLQGGFGIYSNTPAAGGTSYPPIDTVIAWPFVGTPDNVSAFEKMIEQVAASIAPYTCNH